MAKYLFYILDIFSVIAILVCIFFVFKNRKKALTNKFFWAYMLSCIVLFFFAVKIHINSAYVIKLSNLEKELDTLVEYYKSKNKGYPNNIDDFINESYINGRMNYYFYPYNTPRLQIQISQISDSTCAYLIYYLGFDNDDDHLKITYTLDPLKAFNLWVNGDVVLKKDEVPKQLIAKTIKANRI